MGIYVVDGSDTLGTNPVGPRHWRELVFLPIKGMNLEEA